ncbi:hypothetical protein [Austwickia sp. TVS 96-490-7B]|uniref:hypothetical protein n=1 Tax=Austwickia sp. TVS 96-490-7B TaxID=2830843 RepID=UPI001C56E774|nr:hypothetical protein [Austwickia sp. TVS 96-490-7B]
MAGATHTETDVWAEQLPRCALATLDVEPAGQPDSAFVHWSPLLAANEAPVRAGRGDEVGRSQVRLGFVGEDDEVDVAGHPPPSTAPPPLPSACRQQPALSNDSMVRWRMLTCTFFLG